jgi:putative ABC transport system permease protein
MPVGLVFSVALIALRRNGLRTVLTMLGMVIGVGAVITIVALGAGAHEMIEEDVMSAGTNLVVVSAGNWTSGGVRLGMGSSSRLTPEDADAITQVPGVAFVAPSVRTRRQLIYRGENWSATVEGTGADLPAIRSWALQQGAFFGPREVANASKVAVIGSIVRDVLFGPGVNPVGQAIRIGSQPFTVVGLLATKGQTSSGEDQDDVVFVPYTTAQKKLMGVTYLRNITASAAAADRVPEVAEEIRALMRIRHGIVSGEPDDFRVRTLEEIVAVRTRTTRTMTSLLAGVAAVSLLVGGLGVMNIMLVSVTERTREIGLRVAVGARGRDVLLQFLMEAVLISLAGGILGIALGLFLSRSLTELLAWPTVVSIPAMGMASGFAAAIGIFFGWYPARKAAAIDPIDALRFE